MQANRMGAGLVASILAPEDTIRGAIGNVTDSYSYAVEHGHGDAWNTTVLFVGRATTIDGVNDFLDGRDITGRYLSENEQLHALTSGLVGGVIGIPHVSEEIAGA